MALLESETNEELHSANMFVESAPDKKAPFNSSDQKLDVAGTQKESSLGESKKVDNDGSSLSIQPRQCSGAIEEVKEMKE